MGGEGVVCLRRAIGRSLGRTQRSTRCVSCPRFDLPVRPAGLTGRLWRPEGDGARRCRPWRVRGRRSVSSVSCRVSQGRRLWRGRAVSASTDDAGGDRRRGSCCCCVLGGLGGPCVAQNRSARVVSACAPPGQIGDRPVMGNIDPHDRTIADLAQGCHLWHGEGTAVGVDAGWREVGIRNRRSWVPGRVCHRATNRGFGF